ncbi:putative amidohydrolase YtcJ [Haloactinomyces albus]|uniref:Amidohydrolase YtcJ n=1 Tax=Haloactinomyces albus TaxID=1352928 RepID=A0AAE3ZAP1_9ACTN|nr:putative amidohydrolase YtcJ [Haloactinomyces albus]
MRSFTDAVAVHHGRITALGSAAVGRITASGTTVIDLRGRLLLPGFQDAHVHPVYGGLQRLRCDLTGSTDASDCLRRVGEYTRAHPEVAWLLGGGWDIGHFPAGAPAREPLDAVTGDRPAYLVNQDHHGAWVNTAALRHAGIDRDTPDPPDGRIERDAAGHPAGVLHEGATRLATRVIPAATDHEYRQGLLAGQRYLHSCGVTAWQDAIIGPYLGYADTLDLYAELDRQGLLTARCTGALWWDRARDETQIPELLSRRARARGSRFRAETVKIMQDGICENHTAAMLEPYLGGHGSGHSHVDAEALARGVCRLDAEGFQVHFHAIGDRAIREALDAVAQARSTNGMNDLRHQIAHVQVVHPDDVARFRALGVAANIQARWAVNDVQMTELTTPYLGRSRTRRQYPFRALRQAGAVLAAGSDWPISGPEPLQAVHAAINRSEYGTDQKPFLPEQALDLGDALTAATLGSAWVNHLDDETGSVELGKKADLTVLDADPFLLPATEIGSVSVDMTVVDGQVVHERSR